MVKKLEIQVIITMIVLTRSSERISNPSRYTGNNNVYQEVSGIGQDTISVRWVATEKIEENKKLRY